MKTLNQFLDESMGGGVPLTPQELEIQKKMSRLNVRLARKRSQQMQKAKVDDTETAPEQVKEGVGDAVKKGLKRHKDAVEKKKIKNRKAVPYAALAAEHQPEGEMVEAKVDKGRSDYGKATIRNYRRSGPDTVEPAMFDPENKRGKTIDKRREEHKARRGVKGAKVPAYKVSEEKKKGLDGKACWKGYRLAGTKKKGGKTVDNCVKEEDKAFNFVVNKLKAKYGSGVMTKGDKMPEPSAAQKKKNAAIRAKRAKEDHRDPTEKASDGRYSDRYSNRGSD